MGLLCICNNQAEDHESIWNKNMALHISVDNVTLLFTRDYCYRRPTYSSILCSSHMWNNYTFEWSRGLLWETTCLSFLMTFLNPSKTRQCRRNERIITFFKILWCSSDLMILIGSSAWLFGGWTNLKILQTLEWGHEAVRNKYTRVWQEPGETTANNRLMLPEAGPD